MLAPSHDATPVISLQRKYMENVEAAVCDPICHTEK